MCKYHVSGIVRQYDLLLNSKALLRAELMEVQQLITEGEIVSEQRHGTVWLIQSYASTTTISQWHLGMEVKNLKSFLRNE